MIAGADDTRPTAWGLLVLGIRTRDYLPGAYIQFLRLAGTGLAGPIVDEQEIDGTIGDAVRRVEEKLAAHNRVAVDVTSGPLETRRQLYPLAALQQLVRNAVMHRTYEATNAPVRVSWFDDRIEIINPGGPYGAVTAETFGRPGVADYRNPNLAEELRVLGFVQRYGAGIAIARRQLERNGNPPLEFAVEPNYIGAIVQRAG
jgi:ATP-dependent DNA helicase RecG